MSELEDIPDSELERILAERRAKRERLEFLNRAYDQYLKDMENLHEEALEMDARLYAVFTLSYVGVRDTYEGQSIELKLSKYREDIVAIIAGTHGRIYDYNTKTNLIPLEEWATLKEKLLKLPRLIFDDSINEIDKLKLQAHFSISRDERSFYITTARRAPTYEIRAIPGCTQDDKHKRWKYPLTEGWRICKLMHEYEDAKHVVEWQGDAREFAEEQYEKRMSLDIIAKKEKSDIHVVMNNHSLHEYQNLSVEFAEAAGNKVLIGLEMGLGKTPIAIALAERMVARGEGSTILLVLPASVIPNWRRQLLKFTGLQAYRFEGERPSPFEMFMAGKREYRYYIINYDILSTVTNIPEKIEPHPNGKDTIKIAAHTRQLWVDVINRMLKPDMIIVDEIHYIQNYGSYRSRAVRELVAPRRIGLSGTPFTGYAPQLHPVLSFIDPEVAGSNEGFIKYYTLDGKNAKNLEELRDVMRPIMFRKTKKEVLKELPPIQRIIRETTLSAGARKRYDKVLHEGVLVAIDEWSGDTTDMKRVQSILAQLMILKQICVEDRVDYIADLAKDLYDQSENGHRKVIIFTQFVNNPPIISQLCHELGDEAVSFSGEDQVEDRMKVVDKFQTDHEVKYLVCSIKAAGEGLDITAAGHVIFADLMWTPASHHQAEARAYGRMSDLHSIDAYYTVAEDTLEDNHIMPLLEQKLNTFNAVIEGTELTRGDSSILMAIIKGLKQKRR